MPLSDLVIGLILSFIFGAAFASFFIISSGAILLLAVLSSLLFLLFTFAKKKKTASFFLFVIFFFLGIIRFQLAGYSSIFSKNVFQGFSKTIDNKIENYFSPPHSSILSAIVLGKSYKISKGLNDKLSLAGVRHITAVSGMHIVIISMIFFWLFLRLGIARQKSYILIMIIVWLFVALIGFRPSAIRAGVMASFLIFSQEIGRPRLSGRFLLYAAFIMLLANPFLLRWSLSFQLSFLATAGIIYLSPLIKFYLDKVSLMEKSKINNLLALTISAQLAVFPLLIYNFGKISIISPITNILIIPVLPFLLSFFFIFLLFSFFIPLLAFVLSLPIWLLLEYIILIVSSFSSFSFSAIIFPQKVSFLIVIILYGLIVGGLILLRGRNKDNEKLLFETSIIN